MAGISYVFTISRVAEMLGEDEEWLDEISSNWIQKTVVSTFSASAKNRQPPLHASASITSLSSCRLPRPKTARMTRRGTDRMLTAQITHSPWPSTMLKNGGPRWRRYWLLRATGRRCSRG